MKTQLLLLALLLSSFSFAQMRKARGEVFPLDRELKKGGVFIAPGVTYLIGYAESTLTFTDQNIVNFQTSTPKGKLGGALQLGWFHSFENTKYIDFIDFGASYKLFRGEIKTVIDLTDNLTNQTNTTESSLAFNDSHIGLFFNITKTTPIQPNVFLTNSIGINYDYRIIEGGGYSSNGQVVYHNYPPFDVVQLHYKLGIGFKVAKKLLVIPSIETPIVSLFQNKEYNPSLRYGSQEFQPLIFSLQFFFLREDPVNCNSPVYNGPKYEVD